MVSPILKDSQENITFKIEKEEKIKWQEEKKSRLTASDLLLDSLSGFWTLKRKNKEIQIINLQKLKNRNISISIYTYLYLKT